MRFIGTGVSGATLIVPEPHHDERGRFMRAWCYRELGEHGIGFLPLQANLGFSTKKGTVRGLHFQEAPATEAKLVRCTRGSIFDVVLDLRPASPSYMKWHAAELSADNGRMLYVPVGCAHGFQTLEDRTEIYYMTSAYYTPSAARGVRFDDPTFAIKWPMPPSLISKPDRSWPLVTPKDRFAWEVTCTD